MLTNNQLLAFIFFAIINIFAFIFVGVDKKQSIEKNQRIPEVNLFFISVFFASLGVFAGMLFFRHKTRKIYFVLGIGLLFLQHLALALLLS